MYYRSARPQIKSGDLLAFSHFGWKSWRDIKIQGIRMFTRSEYSHVGIAWVVGSRVLCLEAVTPLVRIFPLSSLGEFYWFETGIDWKPEIEQFALSIVGQEYSQWQAIQSAFTEPAKDNLWQCCEYAREVLRLGGVDLGKVVTPTAIVKAAQALDFPGHFVLP